MRVLVLGAAGGVGSRVVGLAAAAGHEVVAGARTLPVVPSGVLPLQVDVRDGDAIRRALTRVDAVLWCVGVTPRSGAGVGRVGMAHLVTAAHEAGASRLVVVSGAGVTVPGDRKGVGARLASALARRLARDVVQDKEAEHAVLLGSDLDWTVVRPPG